MLIDRRLLLGGGAALVAMPALAAAPRAKRWTFDNLHRIGGHAVTMAGAPRQIGDAASVARRGP